MVAGLFAALFLLGGYFVNELVHYRIVFERWRVDLEGWDRERPLVIVLFVGGVLTFLSSLWLLP